MTTSVADAGARAPLPDISPKPVPLLERVMVVVFVVSPIVGVVCAVPFFWGWGLGWTDVAIFAFLYPFNALGITVGYHRMFTHGGFKAKRWVKIALAILGGQAWQGSVLFWVADHRRHHKYADKEGDPHSPWAFGPGAWGLTKGLFHAHMGWLFRKRRTSRTKYCPDLLKDPDLLFLGKDPVYFVIVLSTLAVPMALGGLLTWSWHGAVTALFWAGLLRVFAGDHVTFSINSICHVFGRTDFQTRDHSRNVWWLAIPSFGESWHNLHHADPTCARHGVLKGQIDISARVIWLMEKAGWVWDVRWPDEKRLSARRINPEAIIKSTGQSANVPTGQSTSVSAGQSVNVPAGKTAGVLADQSAIVPAGKTGSVPAGQSAIVPAGETGSVSAGQPANVPAGEAGDASADESTAAPTTATADLSANAAADGERSLTA